jgi:uncharacterized protein (DUF1778 family)
MDLSPMTFRVSPNEKRFLEVVARSLGMNLSEFVRWSSTAVAAGVTAGHPEGESDS